jgi:hypothetical protein
MERKNSICGTLSLVIGTANLLGCFFLFRVGEAAQLLITVDSTYSGSQRSHRTVSTRNLRVNAIFGTFAVLIPIGFLLLMYIVLVNGGFNPMCK